MNKIKAFICIAIIAILASSCQKEGTPVQPTGRKGKIHIVGVDVGAGPDYSCQTTVKFEKDKITVLKVKRIC